MEKLKLSDIKHIVSHRESLVVITDKEVIVVNSHTELEDLTK